MLNAFILGRFLNFLRVQGLYDSYFANVVASNKNPFTFLDALFSVRSPDKWIVGAFLWADDSSVDWRAVNNLWCTRLGALKNNKRSK